MGDDHDTLRTIANAQTTASEKDQLYWLWLSSAYSILRSRVPDIFGYQLDLERSYGAAKQIVMELWAIRSFLIKLRVNLEEFDKLIPNIRAFRDAIAHIDERAEGMLVIKGKQKPISKSRASLAGGLLQSDDGVHWTGFKFCYGIIGTSDGLYTTFGLVRDWIVTNTDGGAVELQLTPNLFAELDKFIRRMARDSKRRVG
ncbi:MAG: hypothetical protein ACRECV_10725 [Xanthobacteraceae bacterium]